MDPIALIALVLFVLLFATWILMPGTATGVTAKDAEASLELSAQKASAFRSTPPDLCKTPNARRARPRGARSECSPSGTAGRVRAPNPKPRPRRSHAPRLYKTSN